jgi:hypothetical protein
MFAEDVGLLHGQMFKSMLDHAHSWPDEFEAFGRDLFRAMRMGGRIGFEPVDWFNGGLFDDDTVIPLDRDDIMLARGVAGLDWSDIDTSIFGTLFERGLDPDKRSQLGAHYTDHAKIMMIVDPVIIQPWITEWERVKATIAALKPKDDGLHRSRISSRQIDFRVGPPPEGDGPVAACYSTMICPYIQGCGVQM